jgi:segregation and condensation protein B
MGVTLFLGSKVASARYASMFRGFTPRVLAPNRPAHMPRNRPLPLVHRLPGELDDDGASADPLARPPALAMLEAALLIADEPLPVRKLVQITSLADAATVRRLLNKLQELYDQDGSAFELEELAGGFQLMTRPEYHRWLTSVRKSQQELRLTAASRETLAIVAYRQPIMRADIESIRGVHCGETLRLLMEKGLVKITGRDDSLGRPVLYGTTKRFLQLFGLKSLKDLPNAEQMKSSRKE